MKQIIRSFTETWTDENGVEQTQTFTFAEGSVKHGLKGISSVLCDVCMASTPVDKTVKYKGKVYGIPCGCSKDVDHLRSLGRR